MTLREIREEIAKFADDQGKLDKYDVEIVCCNVYDRALSGFLRKLGRKLDVAKDLAIREKGVQDVELPGKGKKRNEFTQKVFDLEIGDSLVIDKSSYHGKSPFNSYAYNCCKSFCRVRTKTSENGLSWIVTKLEHYGKTKDKKDKISEEQAKYNERNGHKKGQEV
jgi:hypothetical protein